MLCARIRNSYEEQLDWSHDTSIDSRGGANGKSGGPLEPGEYVLKQRAGPGGSSDTLPRAQTFKLTTADPLEQEVN